MIVKRLFFVALIIFSLCSGQFLGRLDIYSGKEQIGQCDFSFDQTNRGYLLTSNTVITVAGTQTLYDQRTELDFGFHPMVYYVSVTTPSGKQNVNVSFRDGKALLKTEMGIGSTEKALDFSSSGFILDQNVFDHFFILAKALDYSVGRNQAQVIIPQLISIRTLTLDDRGEEDFDGKPVRHIVGEMDGEKVELFVEPAEKKMVGVLFADKKLMAKLVKFERKAEESGIPQNCHPLTEQDLLDKDKFSSMTESKKITCKISLNPQGKLEKIYLNRFAQVFEGTVSANIIDGTVTSKRVGHKVTLGPVWPISQPLDVPAEYISPAPGIDSDDTEIQSRASSVAANAKTLWDAARSINVWVNKNITYSLIRRGAKQTMASGKGDSHSKTLLCTAMLRSVGIPARVVWGILYSDVPLDHSWVEVFLGPEIGWAPMDPSTGEADNISGSHISLWLGEENPPVWVESIQVDVQK